MNAIETHLRDGSIVSCHRIDIRFVAAGVLNGDNATMLEHLIPRFQKEAGKIYGVYRPIQIKLPTRNDPFDYCVFIDLHSICHAPEKETMVFRDLGVMFFCGIEQLVARELTAKAIDIADWTNCKEYTSEDY